MAKKKQRKGFIMALGYRELELVCFTFVMELLELTPKSCLNQVTADLLFREFHKQLGTTYNRPDLGWELAVNEYFYLRLICGAMGHHQQGLP
jgi:hypothetical protein